MMDRKEFRAELERVLPGFKWRVLRRLDDELWATGVLASGYSEKEEIRVQKKNDFEPYIVFWAGGVGAFEAKTFPRAIRLLQNQYEQRASLFAGLARALESGRKKRIVK